MFAKNKLIVSYFMLALLGFALNVFSNLCEDRKKLAQNNKNNQIILKEHEKWWTIHEKIFSNFTKNTNDVSRIYVRKYIKNTGYSNILDIPCGHCVDFFGFKKDKIEIDYCGMDITNHVIEAARKNGLNVLRGSIENIPFNDNTFDICYSRHILEHLPSYENPISELIRVAKKEALIIFFIKPDEKENYISYTPLNSVKVYHNKYNKNEIESYVKKHDKVKEVKWVNINKEEVALHIYF